MTYNSNHLTALENMGTAIVDRTVEQTIGTAEAVFPWLFGTIWTSRYYDHFLEHSCATDAVPLLPVHRYSFRQPQEDDRLSQPHLVLIQHPMGLELRTLRSQVSHPNHKANTRLNCKSQRSIVNST